MLSIVFTILKIAGYILLALLCLILLAILLVLFVPIRYHAAGSKYEDFNANADVTWLLKLLHVLFSFDNKLEEDKVRLQVKVLGFTVYSNLKPEKEEEKENPVPEEIPVQEQIIDEEPENKEESGGIPEDTETEREPETPEETVSPEEEIPSDVPKQEKESAKEKLKKKEASQDAVF